MTDREGAVGPIARAIEPTATRPVHAHVGTEQIDLYERFRDEGHNRPSDHIVADLVVTLTRDEVGQIEDHLPAGSTVASIIGRVLTYHPMIGEQRHPRHPSPGDGHVDVDV